MPRNYHSERSTSIAWLDCDGVRYRTPGAGRRGYVLAGFAQHGQKTSADGAQLVDSGGLIWAAVDSFQESKAA